MSGWICSYRKIWQHPLFRGNAQRVGAWHWMMHMAVVADTRFMADGREVRLSRGQFCASQQQICDATGMTRKQVRSFLDALEAESAVVLKRANDAAKGRTIVTICNYDQYQNMPESEGPRNGQERAGDKEGPKKGQGRAKDGAKDGTIVTICNYDQYQSKSESEGPRNGQERAKEGPTKEQYNKKQEETPLPPKGGDAEGFGEFWDAYPHRGAKKNRKGAEAKFAKVLKSGVTADQIMAGVRAMMADPDVKRGFARDPVTWLNQEGWRDEHGAGRSPAGQPQPGGTQQWPDGSLRALGPNRVQEFLFGRWENRSDLTEALVLGHPKYIGRTSAYRSEAHAV